MALPKEDEAPLNPLAQALAPVKRHRQNVSVVEGVCALLAGATAYALVIGWTDWLTLLDWTPRAGLLLVLMAAVAYIVARHIVHPWTTPPSDEQAARWVDTAFESFRGHVLSAIQLHAMTDSEHQTPESRELIRIGVERVARDLAGERVESAVSKKLAVYLAAVAVLFVTVATAVVAVGPRHSAASLARVLLLRNVGYPTRTQIAAITPGDTTVKEGEPLWLDVIGAGEKPEAGEVVVTMAGREESRLALHRAGDALYRVQLPQVDADFQYEIRLGDARSKAFRVTVLSQPRLAVQVRVTDAEGVQLADASTSDGDASVMEGTHVHISAQSTKTLVQASFESKPRIPGVAVKVSGQRVILPRIVATESFTYHLHVEDEEGVTNHPPRKYRVRVTTDEPPEIALGAEGGRIEVLPDALAALTYSAKDDIGLDSIEMVYSIQRASREHLATDGGTVSVVDCQDQKAMTGEFLWDLDPFSLEPGDKIRVHMRVRDTRSLGANVAESGATTIHVVASDRLSERYQEELADTVRLHLTPIIDELRQLRVDTTTAASQPEVGGDDARELAKRQAALNERITDFDEQHWGRIGKWIENNRAEQHEPFSELADSRAQVRELQEKHLTPAFRALEVASEEGTHERTSNLGLAADLQQTAEQILQDVADDVLPFAALARCKSDMQEILTGQEALLNETRTCCHHQLSNGDSVSSETLQDLARRQGDVHREYLELDESLSQLADNPEMPSQVREALEKGRESAVCDSTAAASDYLERGRTMQAFESQYDAYRGMVRQNATLQSSDRDRETQANKLANRLEELLPPQRNTGDDQLPVASQDDVQTASDQDATTWALQKAAEQASAIEAEAARSLERGLRQSANAGEDLLAGEGETAKRRQQTAEAEIATAQRHLRERGHASKERPSADELFEQADYWKQTQREAEQLAREQGALAASDAKMGLKAESAQQEIAAQSAQLADQTTGQHPGSEAARSLREAARHAQQAAEDLQGGEDPASARQQQQQAAERMNHAAQAAASQSDDARTQAQQEKGRQLQNVEQQLETAMQGNQESTDRTQEVGSDPPQSTLDQIATAQDDQADRLEQIAESAPAGSEQTQKAADHSRNAAEELRKGNADAAQQQQQMAASDMQAAQQEVKQAQSETQNQMASGDQQSQDLQELQKQLESTQGEMQSMKQEMEQQMSSGTKSDSQQQAQQRMQQQQQLTQQIQQMAAGAKAGSQQLGRAAQAAEAAGQAMEQGDMQQAIQRQDEAIRFLDQARQQVAQTPASPNGRDLDPPDGAELPPPEPPEPPEIKVASGKLMVNQRYREAINNLKDKPPEGYEKRIKDYTSNFRFIDKP